MNIVNEVKRERYSEAHLAWWGSQTKIIREREVGREGERESRRERERI